METILIIGLVIALYFIALVGLAFGAGESTTPTPSLDDSSSGASMFDDDSFTSSCTWCGSLTCMGICDHDSASSSIDHTSMFDDSSSSHSMFDD